MTAPRRRRRWPHRLVMAVMWLWFVVGAGGARAFAQYPQPLPDAPTAPQFLSRYDFHLAAAYLHGDDPTFFMWDTHWGGDFDLVDYVSGRFGFLVDYQAILGDEIRPFDPNQGNYTLEFSGSQRLGRTELAGVFHHVSRHLSDRPKRPAVAMNVLEARLLRRFDLSPTALVDVKAEGGKVIAHAYVDYTWIGKLDVTARKQVNRVVGAYGRLLGELYATDVTVAGRRSQKGGRIETGVRIRGQGGAMDLFDRRPRSWSFAGFRLVN